MKKNFALKALSLILVVSIAAAFAPPKANANDSKLRLGVVSDIHYYPASLKGSRGEEWKKFLNESQKQYDENDSLIENALDGMLENFKRGERNFVLVPGDLTKDGELEAHRRLAEKLESFEENTGVQVLVVPGNHDVNNSNACTFENGKREPASPTSPEQFREIYKNLGYDLADSFFTPAPGKKGGGLSYAATLGDYRLIAIDSCMYSEDNGAERDEHMTDGRIGGELLEWVLEECARAKEQGLTIIGSEHHSVLPHSDIMEATIWAFVVKDWLKTADILADAGMHFVFSGHIHANDINYHISDNGEAIYDILTPSLTNFPNFYRIVEFNSNGGKVDVKVDSHDIDEYRRVANDDGTEYPKPFKYTHSFERTFGERGIKTFAMNMIKSPVTNVFAEIRAAGGLLNFLNASGINLEKIIVDALGTNGLAIGDAEILTVSANLMGLIKDLAAQIDSVYINEPDATIAKIDAIVDKLLNFKLSDKPALMNSDKLEGYPIARGCTLGDLATTILLTYYPGDEDVSSYPYVREILDAFDDGTLAEKLFGFLKEVVVDDLVHDEILARLDFNPGALFPPKTLFYVFGRILQGAAEAFLGGDNSFANLVDSVLSLPIIPDGYGSIDEIIDSLLGKYLTFSQFESWGHTISWMLSSFMFDDVPYKNCDIDAELSYKGPVEVEATRENFRLPSNVVVTLGGDSATELNVAWLTKYSVAGSDIELLPGDSDAAFTGRPTTDARITSLTDSIDKTYPGADFGLFGLLPFSKAYTKHVVKLSGLVPGEKYRYRVGDAERGWWSDEGVLETASNKNEFAFFYVTDPQAQRPSHYKIYSNVMEKARRLYPDGKFVVCCGDQVDDGTNCKQWNYFLNSTDAFLNLPFMPVSGNHEDKKASVSENFILPGVAPQNEESGVYYSYDYNNVHFTVLNTNDITDDKLDAKQLKWLENDLKSSGAQWKILILHKALYSNGSHFDDKEVVGMRKQLSALLPYLDVDIVLQGHDHVYMRTGVMNANSTVPVKTDDVDFDGRDYGMKLDPQGSIYAICGTSGVKVYASKEPKATDRFFPRPEVAVDSAYPMFAAVTVKGDSLYYDAYQVIGDKTRRADSFAVKKIDGKLFSVKEPGGPTDKFITDLFSRVNVGFAWKFLSFAASVLNGMFGLFRNTAVK